MKFFLILVSFLSIHCGMSQRLSLKITTDLSVDSVYLSGKVHNFEKINDTIVQLVIDYSSISANSDIALFSKKRMYKTELSTEDIKNKLSAEFENRAQLKMTKKECTLFTIDGYTMHSLSALQVYALKSEKLLIQECCGVYVEKK